MEIVCNVPSLSASNFSDLMNRSYFRAFFGLPLSENELRDHRVDIVCESEVLALKIIAKPQVRKALWHRSRVHDCTSCTQPCVRNVNCLTYHTPNSNSIFGLRQFREVVGMMTLKAQKFYFLHPESQPKNGLWFKFDIVINYKRRPPILTTLCFSPCN